uniref:Uncharacterized protein n=1 Tax=Grammatophora oceanica TaxID=210454 RepID=A0A6U5MHI4_9STRA|mmetsp:Transcript_38191/g.56848  ORF Transcript_38191/g.56848 Transcript_38191/m.56848 type:complete len:133 (+) Transcript_38191:120-518(+)
MSKITILLSFLFLMAISCLNGVAAVENEKPEFIRSRELATCAVCSADFLGKPSCTGFTFKAADVWDSYAELAEADSSCSQRCCASSEEMCCDDYTTGFWAGFIVGMVGLGLLICYCFVDCVILPRRKAASDE